MVLNKIKYIEEMGEGWNRIIDEIDDYLLKSENPDLNLISSLFFGLFNSSSINFGAKSLTLSENNISSFFVCISLPLAMIAEKISLASTIRNNVIYSSGYLLFRDLYAPISILSANSFASFSVNLDFDASDSKTTLCSADDSESCFSNSFNKINCLIKLGKSKFDSSAFCFNSSGISIDICAILINTIRINNYLRFLVEKAVSGINRMNKLVKEWRFKIKFTDTHFYIEFKQNLEYLKMAFGTTQKTTQKILELIRENPRISRRELGERILNITEDGIKYNLNKLVKLGLLKRVGPAKGGYWEVVEIKDK
ncbi:MAG: winged helix-turn-helix transcriptional regulator [archaeon]